MHPNHVHCSEDAEADKIAQEWDGEKENETKAESLEEENQLQEEKLWQLGGVGPRPSNEEGEKMECNLQLNFSTEMVQVLLWTGYGPLQEGDQLWGRVFKALVQPPSSCPESRFVQVASADALQFNIALLRFLYDYGL